MQARSRVTIIGSRFVKKEEAWKYVAFSTSARILPFTVELWAPAFKKLNATLDVIRNRPVQRQNCQVGPLQTHCLQTPFRKSLIEESN